MGLQVKRQALALMNFFGLDMAFADEVALVRTTKGIKKSNNSNLNSVAQQPMRAEASVYCVHPSIHDHWALKRTSRCPNQVVNRKQNPQCFSPQAILVLIYRPTEGMKG
ncbi:hypothetical protein TNCV_1960461 [Trichonephila clavipes]|nr:hypothetical protein TNCV_1960461 [Trichonephila clavipes]